MKSWPQGRQGRVRKVLAVAVSALAIAGAASGQAGPSADELFADGRFADAGAAYEKVLASAPGDPAALAGLARIRLYEGKDAEAQELAQRALAAAPQDPVAGQVLRLVQVRRAAFGGAAFRIQAPPGEAAIAFVATDPLPLVEVTLGASRTALFLIDTGAPDIVVSPDLAQELGLPLSDAGQGVFAGGRRATVQRTTIPELSLGPVTVWNAPAGVLPTGQMIPGRKIEGIIGTGFLRHFLATLDYCGGRLLLAPRGASAAFEVQARMADANIMPMWFVGDHFPVVRARLNQGRESLFLVDTGLAGGGLVATRPALDEAGVKIDEADVRTGMGGGGAARFIPFRADATMGALTVRGVAGVYMPDQPSIFPFRSAGALSHAFFRHSRLTFDFVAMKLVTRACPA
jgi:hypothetical protein